MSKLIGTRIIRLFISSTFSDFIAEREALRKLVFPKLEGYCVERGARFQAVDLRWGITESAQRGHDTMRICLEEVRRCQQLSPRPNFVVLMGDRYGWEPVPARIPQDHWNQLKLEASSKEWKLISSSYRRDENAIPPVYCLYERIKDQSVAFDHEAKLLQALRRAANGFQGTARLPYFASATHQEIALGALSKRDEQGCALDPEHHVHVYVRHIDKLPHDSSAKEFIDWDASKGQVVSGARHRLRVLETQLRRQLGDHVHDLHTHWSSHGLNGTVDKSYIKLFCQIFLEHQIQLIDAELTSHRQTDDHQQREKAHQEFAAERARVFAGRKALLTRIARRTTARINSNVTKASCGRGAIAPLILLGNSGCGKSALLARAAREAIQATHDSNCIILQRYIGGVPGTESLMNMLGAITADIARLYDQPQPVPADNIKMLSESFHAALSHAVSGRPLVLYLDAVDQLNRADGAWMLEWLPKRLPKNVCVLATIRTGTIVEQSARKRYPRSLIEIPPLRPVEGRAVLQAWLKDKRAAWFNAGISPPTGRRLTPIQQQAVLSAFKNNGSALWLKLAYEESATWASWDDPRKLPTTIEGMIENLIEHRLLKQQNHPRMFTERAIAYLTAGRFGLSECELGRALATDEAVRAEFQFNEMTNIKWEEQKALPAILWSRLYFDLAAYLGLVQVDGTLLMRWFHREFEQALKHRYLSVDEDRKATHGALADTFSSLELELRPGENGDDSLFRFTNVNGTQVSVAMRRVMEQPWQLAQAGRSGDLKALLTNFGFCMGKCAGNAGTDLIEDYNLIGIEIGSEVLFQTWLRFFQAKGYLLRRGTTEWPAHKIFLQIAREHAKESIVTLEAEKWLRLNLCGWSYLTRVNRPERELIDGCKAVFEGHQDVVNGVLKLDDFTLLSWSRDNTLRTWNLATGRLKDIYHGHLGPVLGVLLMPDGNILSWSEDHTLVIWDSATGALLIRLKGHRGRISGAVLLDEQQVLSWSDDCTLRIWNISSGCLSKVLRGHERAVTGAMPVSGGRLISWSKDKSLRIWTKGESWSCIVLNGHRAEIGGALTIEENKLLSWSGGSPHSLRSRGDRTLRAWEIDTGKLIWTVTAHQQDIINVISLSNGQLLSCSRDKTMAIWRPEDGRLEKRLIGHTHWVMGAFELNQRTLISWSQDDTIRVWNIQEGVSATVEEVARPVWSGLRVDDNRFAIWSDVFTIWDTRELETPIRLIGHSQTIIGAIALSGNDILTWSTDETIRRWDASCVDGTRQVRSPIPGNVFAVGRAANDCGHLEWVRGVISLSSGDAVSWSYDHSLRIWDPDTGKCKSILCGHRFWVMGAIELPGKRLVSWSYDCDVRVWDLVSGCSIATLKGTRRPGKSRAWNDASTHDHFVDGVIMANPETVVSWAQDHTIRIWSLQTLEETHLIEIESLPDDVFALNDKIFASWSQDENLVYLWVIANGKMLSRMTLDEFTREFPSHRRSINDVDLVEKQSFLAGELTVTVRDGALKIVDSTGTNIYWHGNRDLELFFLSQRGVICARLSEKDLGFIRLEVPQIYC